jgi:anaerobic magnesium-protoporphyrin IX monomethyl ester cyclase
MQAQEITLMKIFLVRSGMAVLDRGNVFPPMNLLGLSSILRKKGHTVSILDQLTQHSSREQLLRKVAEERPDIVGFTSMTYDIQSVHQDITLIKQQFPGITTLLGGTHVTSLPERTLTENRYIDIAVIGEGERVIDVLFDHLADHSSLKGIKGIAWRDGDTIVMNPPEAFIENMDTIPFPDYDLLTIDDYRYSQRTWEKRRFMSILTSRGCPFPCTFCARSVFGKQVRLHSAEYVVRHIEFLYHTYGVRGIGIMDDTFTINRQRVLDICRMLQAKQLDLIWFCFSSVNTIDQEMLTAMAQAGCVKISYGVESGNREIQKKIRKNLDFEKVANVFNWTRAAKIESLAFFMIGNPGETRQSIQESKQLAKRINPDFINVAILCPLPGSEIYEEFKHQLPTDWSRFQITPFHALPVLQLGELTSDEMRREMKRFYRDFFLRPAYIWSRIKKIRSLADIRFYVQKALSLYQEFF